MATKVSGRAGSMLAEVHMAMRIFAETPDPLSAPNDCATRLSNAPWNAGVFAKSSRLSPMLPPWLAAKAASPIKTDMNSVMMRTYDVL